VCGTTVVAFAFVQIIKAVAVNFGEPHIQAVPAEAVAVTVLCQDTAEVGKVFVKAMSGKAEMAARAAPTLTRLIQWQVNGE
jgi:hypothetical protein